MEAFVLTSSEKEISGEVFEATLGVFLTESEAVSFALDEIARHDKKNINSPAFTILRFEVGERTGAVESVYVEADGSISRNKLGAD